MLTTDVCILGAGPGGAATALRLSYLGIPCILLDKATFPRDKICGDAISGKVTTLLNRMDPAMMERFHDLGRQVDVWGIRFVAPNRKALDLPFEPNYVREEKAAPGYVAKRVDFDNFLIEEVKRRPDITFKDGVEVRDFERTPEGYQLTDKTGDLQIQCKLFVDASGAHSPFSRRHAGLAVEPSHHAGALRAYYRGVTDMPTDNFIELRFLKELTPGYFWVFPLPNGEANVGLGMRTDVMKRKKINLRETMERVIQEHPDIAPRFQHAERIGSVHGYGLPLGSKKRPLSGDHYLLVGDAAHLVDPLTGEGIGNAFYSGVIAAEQAEKCLEADNYSADFLKDYDVRVQRVLGEEMRLTYQLQQMARYPWIVNVIANIISSNKKVIDYISAMYTDFALREQLVKPWFWVKMMLRR